MKKIKLITLVITTLVALTSCGNYDIGFGSYKFTKAHVQMYGGEPVHLKIEKWLLDEGGIELKTKNFGNILLGDGTYMMYDSEDCPICGSVEYR